MRKKQPGLSFKNGVKDGIPVSLGYLSVSFAFGVHAVALGLPIWIAVLTSMTNLTSAGQIAGVSVIAAAGGFAEIIVTQLVFNSRYFLMGVNLSQRLCPSFGLRHKLLVSMAVTDEIFGIAASKPLPLTPRYMYGLALLPYAGWTLGTLLGAAAGSALPAVITSALGISLYSVFVAIITPASFKETGVAIAVALGAGISCAFYYIPALNVVPTGFTYVIAAVVAAAVAAAIFPTREEEPENADD